MKTILTLLLLTSVLAAQGNESWTEVGNANTIGVNDSITQSKDQSVEWVAAPCSDGPTIVTVKSVVVTYTLAGVNKEDTVDCDQGTQVGTSRTAEFTAPTLPAGATDAKVTIVWGWECPTLSISGEFTATRTLTP